MTQTGAAETEPSSTGTGGRLITRIEQVLGENTAPDAAFFLDSWTVGVGAASENFQRRQEQRKNRANEISPWNTFPSFTPLVLTGIDTSFEAVYPVRKAYVKEDSEMVLPWAGDGTADDPQPQYEVEMIWPSTLESASRVLGVGPTSTREQIRAAYRKMACQYHPDRVARGGTSEQKLASDRMASLKEAYRLLSSGLSGQSSTSV